MLTRLSEVLSIDILSIWCDLKTVAKTNSAFCNKMDRQDLLGLLCDPTFASTDSTYPRSNSFLKWIATNGIKVRLMKEMSHLFSDFLVVTKIDCSKVFEFHVDSLERVDDVAILINKSIHLKTLNVCSDYVLWSTDEALNKMLSLVSDQILSGLTVLSIRVSTNEHHPIPLDLSCIALTCTHLRRLSLNIQDCKLPEHQVIQILENNKQLQRLMLESFISCTTDLMTAIAKNCLWLQLLVIADIHTDGCSIESVCAMLTSCKQLTFCNLVRGFRLSTINIDLFAIEISSAEFMPIFSQVLDTHGHRLSQVGLYYCRIEESVLVQIRLKCPQLTKLCVSEPWYSYSVNTLRSIVTRCTKLTFLVLSYVDATYDEMVSIFCSNQVLMYLRVATTTPHVGLAEQIKKHNPSIRLCETDGCF